MVCCMMCGGTDGGGGGGGCAGGGERPKGNPGDRKMTISGVDTLLVPTKVQGCFWVVDATGE